MTTYLRRTVAALVAAAALALGGFTLGLATNAPAIAATEDPCLPAPDAGTVPGQIITSSQITQDVQITGTQAAPQVLMTTAPATFDGGPVVVEFSAQYLNHLPSATTNLNGIAFELMIDGVAMERMALAGTHSQTNDFWPIAIRDVLDTAPRLIPAGQHTVGIRVYRWSPVQDGYLKYNAGAVSGWGMPIRLTVTDAG